MRFVIAAAITFLAAPAFAEVIDVKYAGPVDLGAYECQTVTRSSLVNRVCFNEAARSMIVLLKTTYYAYCDVPTALVSSFYAAESMGRFYTQQIKSDAVAGKYACND